MNFIKRRLQHRFFSVNITNFLITAFFMDQLRWLLLGTASNRRHSKKYMRQNSKENMLHNSFSVDIMVYALQLKQKFTTGVFHEIVRHFRTATFENKLWWLILKRKQRRRRARSDPCEFRF